MLWTECRFHDSKITLHRTKPSNYPLPDHETTGRRVTSSALCRRRQPRSVIITKTEHTHHRKNRAYLKPHQVHGLPFSIASSKLHIDIMDIGSCITATVAPTGFFFPCSFRIEWLPAPINYRPHASGSGRFPTDAFDWKIPMRLPQ